jgi:hypothetical protein
VQIVNLLNKGNKNWVLILQANANTKRTIHLNNLRLQVIDINQFDYDLDRLK